MSDGHFPGPDPVRLAGDGLVLREWRDEDLPVMAKLFDEPEVRRWTPLASPFDAAAARAYLDRAHARREEGCAVQLAVTGADDRPMGEVLLFVNPDVAEIGWALGAAHRGRRVASRAVRLLVAAARDRWRIERLRALIEPGNAPSEHVAAACGFVAVPGPPVLVESRIGTVGLTAWHLVGPDGVPWRARTPDPVVVSGDARGSG